MNIMQVTIITGGDGTSNLDSNLFFRNMAFTGKAEFPNGIESDLWRGTGNDRDQATLHSEH
jgi:hypothetical protein